MYNKSRKDNVLFWNGELSATLENHLRSAEEKVNSVSKEQFLATPIDDLIEHISNQLYVEPLQIYENSMEMSQREIQIDISNEKHRNRFVDRGPILVSGISVTISIPYSGDPKLWKLQPNQWRSILPRADIRNPQSDGIGYINIVMEQPSDDLQEKIKRHLDSELENIRFYINAQSSQIRIHNSKIEISVKRLVEARRERLSKYENLSEFLKIPLKRNPDSPAIKPINMQKRLVKPLPPIPKDGHRPEPGITNQDYEHILSVIRHEGATFEVTPSTYSIHDEEELRDIILAHLNGHYQGGAAGETFRKSGKTDIRIEDNSRAAFVAECKVWRGANELNKAVNQLLSYLTWRDCKASLIFFNKKNAKFTEILDKVPGLLRSHSRFKKFVSKVNPNEWSVIFMSQEDDARLIEIRVFAFNLFVSRKNV
jgi:hypothetical protein